MTLFGILSLRKIIKHTIYPDLNRVENKENNVLLGLSVQDQRELKTLDIFAISQNNCLTITVYLHTYLDEWIEERAEKNAE